MRINLTLGNMPGNGGSQGSVVNHVGFIVNNVQEQVAKWKANGVAVLPGGNGRLDQAYVETPDGLQAAQARMAEKEVNTRWQEFMAPFFESPNNARPDEMFVELAEIFHID